MIDARTLAEGLAKALARAGMGAPEGLHRLTGGATMESWRFSSGGEDFVLRRAPSLEFMQDRPYGHATEAAVIRAARAAGVTAPEVVVELAPEDGIGSGFVMRALPGTPNPKEILAMEDPAGLLRQVARDLARIHSLRPGDVPGDVPVMDYRAAIADLRRQFEEAGGDRPIIALGLKWMEDNCPEPCEPVLNHGDYRMGNILAENSDLTGVLDWELAHFGDSHEDLAFGCMAVWRFHRYDRPALGLGSLADYFAAYEAESGRTVDRDRFRYWLVHRTVWWAMGCLRCARVWRDGSDRMLERVVISRRTSEQELDLLMLLEEDALTDGITPKERMSDDYLYFGEAQTGEIATAVSEWLATIKDRLEGHDRFQLAVARNALGILARQYAICPRVSDKELADDFLSGKRSMMTDPTIPRLRRDALDKLETDSPKYPALAVARALWSESTEVID
ncbi:phosphotransferase [Erythrobacter sp. HL-111]|uniref:phosphotransferase n=1 Tax=Erythrobacter sp. HL-111 TaxID=1798193 RepID=UPI0006DA53C5|nr:phosphotransferase [Erythrobacter sp. HL-111]KPP92550.1 MAG: putative aminoglycoside phosphotransferase [Erythrobacteraceae bacterium HL-111]SDS91546.1 Predicted kinase, aminoglycoside phosphotransferase (APT) family [Erythrobacter sp. HL-111]